MVNHSQKSRIWIKMKLVINSTIQYTFSGKKNNIRDNIEGLKVHFSCTKDDHVNMVNHGQESMKNWHKWFLYHY